MSITASSWFIRRYFRYLIFATAQRLSTCIL